MRSTGKDTSQPTQSIGSDPEEQSLIRPAIGLTLSTSIPLESLEDC